MTTRRHHRHIVRALGAALAALLPALAALPQAARAQGFTGAYAPANWTTTNTTTWSGSATNDGTTLTLTSPSGDGLPENPQGGLDLQPEIDYSVVAPAAGTVTFDWGFQSQFYNGVPFGYFVGDPSQAGDRFALSGPADHTNSGNVQSGEGSFAVAAGQTFGYYIDSQVGEGALTGALTVTDFSAPAAATPAPEPSSLAAFAAMGLGTAGLIVIKARRQRA